MIRTKGEAGTGDIVNAVAHMRSVFGRDPRAAGSARGGALRRGQGAPRTVRARPVGRRERAPAGRHLHRRWDRDARRRGPLHAARSGRRLRRVGDLQVRPRPDARHRRLGGGRLAPREGDRRGDHALRRPEDPRRGLGGPRRADGRHLFELAHRGRAARSSAAGSYPRLRTSRARSARRPRRRSSTSRGRTPAGPRERGSRSIRHGAAASPRSIRTATDMSFPRTRDPAGRI